MTERTEAESPKGRSYLRETALNMAILRPQQKLRENSCQRIRAMKPWFIPPIVIPLGIGLFVVVYAAFRALS
jgi:hypothetical protein